MSNNKRSTNLDNLLFQKQALEDKIVKLEITPKGIEKSIKKLKDQNLQR
jgi:cell division protein FtsB